ncbi:ACT domain-containing protein [Novosphingobium aquimarinum]|uniref:ACT domain-containing protein n=1 Tax=Novosphingobium aquimarinum TaxID=2682494 RepID=UPI0012EC635F|nr:ACT domain-containing protein [Novosphingobium aquimarinum]
MLAAMDPVLDEETWVFCTFAEGIRRDVTPMALALFREEEGLSAILSLADARSLSLPLDQPMRRITLRVHSALDGVGLTAAVAGELADAGIACNMVAAYHHDHAFVPAADAERALALLLTLQEQVRNAA